MVEVVKEAEMIRTTEILIIQNKSDGCLKDFLDIT